MRNIIEITNSKSLFPNSIFQKGILTIAILFVFILNGIAQAAPPAKPQSLFSLAVELSEADMKSPPNAIYKYRFNKRKLNFIPKLAAFLEIKETDPEKIMVEVCTQLQGNPFITCNNTGKFIQIPEELSSPDVIKNLTSPESYRKMALAPIVAVNSTSTAESLTSSGSLFTTAIDGFSRWLVKRTKQELSAIFFSDFKEKLNQEAYLKTLFPTTVDLLDLIDTDAYQYEAYLNSLREAFYTDFQLLPQQMPVWAKTTKLIDNENDRFLVMEAMRVTPMILEGDKPMTIIDQLGKTEQVPDTFADVFASFRLMKIIFNSLETGVHSLEPISYWEKNIQNDFVYYAFMGLIWHKANSLKYANPKINAQLAQIGHRLTSDNFNQKRDSIKQTVKKFITYANRTSVLVDNLIEQKHQSESQTLHAPAFIGYSNTVVEMIKSSDEFRVNLIGGKPSKSFSALTNILQTSNSMLFNIHEGKYVLGTSNLSKLIEQIYSLKPTNGADNTPADFTDFNKKYFKYVTFMATVADAKSSTEAEGAFDMFALPPGSSRLKKNSNFSVGLNAYVGPAGGSEVLFEGGSKGFFALTAPVGIAISRGFGKTGSLSAFVPVLDVGAVTAFRFGDDSSRLPELNFKNLIAPGIYGVYGFGKNIPLSVGFGAQMGPNLRKITQNGAEFTDRGWRWGAFLAVDIPVFNFYSR